MKKVLSVILLTLISITVYGQFAEAYNYGYGMGMYSNGINALCEGDYDEAFEKFSDGVKYHPVNYEGVGICYELGFGVEIDHDEAWDAYATGARAGSPQCQYALKRIKKNGYWPRSFRRTFLQNLRNSMSAQGYSNGGYNNYGGSSGSSSSSGSVYSTCRICGGSGVCKSCGGTGGEWRDTGYYTGSNVRSWINCGSCSGSKRCFNCHGTGRQ